MHEFYPTVARDPVPNICYIFRYRLIEFRDHSRSQTDKLWLLISLPLSV